MTHISEVAAENKFRSKAKSWINDKGIAGTKYLLEFIKHHPNPVALGVTDVSKEKMINILNGIISDKELEAYAKQKK